MKIACPLEITGDNHSQIYYDRVGISDKARIAKTPEDVGKMYEAISCFINYIQIKKRIIKSQPTIIPTKFKIEN